MNYKKLEKIAKALGDANRLKILDFIAKQGGTGQCGAIVECVNLAQPSVSHHLKILQEADLLEAEKEGRHYRFTIKQETLNEYLHTVALFLPATIVDQE